MTVDILNNYSRSPSEPKLKINNPEILYCMNCPYPKCKGSCAEASRLHREEKRKQVLEFRKKEKEKKEHGELLRASDV